MTHTFADSLEGPMGFSIELSSWLRSVTAKGQAPESGELCAQASDAPSLLRGGTECSVPCAPAAKKAVTPSCVCPGTPVGDSAPEVFLGRWPRG